MQPLCCSRRVQAGLPGGSTVMTVWVSGDRCPGVGLHPAGNCAVGAVPGFCLCLGRV